MENRPRKPWVAGVLTVATLGLGHIYTGEARKGILLYLISSVVAVAAMALFIRQYPVATMLFLLAIGLSFLIYCVVDAVRISNTHKDSYELKAYNKWYIYLLIYIISALAIQPLAVSFIKSNMVQAFKIPAGSMIPTLLIGDHMLVDKKIYKIAEPSRGDIVVFPYPKNPEQDFVKRIVGVAGDIIEIKNKQLFINNAQYDEAYARNVEERIIPGKRNPRDNYGPMTVPENSLFVLGDNRDNSHDSRFWGFVDKDKVRGKAVEIYWSWDRENSSVRWDRIGKKIE